MMKKKKMSLLRTASRFFVAVRGLEKGLLGLLLKLRKSNILTAAGSSRGAVYTIGPS